MIEWGSFVSEVAGSITEFGGRWWFGATLKTTLRDANRMAGAMEVWRCGGVEVWRYSLGVMELWSYGDDLRDANRMAGAMELWSYGGVEVWRHGGMEVWSSGVMELWRRP